MENKLIQQLENVLPEGMNIPEPLIKLYQWIEEKGYYRDNKEDELRVGFLYPEDKLKESWTDDERDGGTIIDFSAIGNKYLKYWFGLDNDEINSRLCVFAQSGGEGSECALWKNDKGETVIVHMGSGSGSLLSCVLAENAVDFLRLIAIGYDEICWDEEFPYPPSQNEEFLVKPNLEFQKWVKETFQVDIPETALEIVKNPTGMDDDESEDEFFNWFKKFVE